jgi:general secretion pathway protein D
MKRAIRPALICFLLLVGIMPTVAESSRSLYKKGKDAEARQNFEQAYDFYKQAFDQNPKELSYRTAYERLRFLAGASHVHRGQLLREAGRLQEALAEFQKAGEIDPSSAIAKQEIQVTNRLIQQGEATPQPSAHQPTVLERRLQDAGAPVELAAIPNVPMTMKQTEDSKIIYETIGKLAGINVLFDPDYTSRRIKVDLNSVSLEEALQIVAMESKTFWRPVTPNTIFVAADNPAKRKEVEQSVIKTFYLSNLSQPTELQDVVNALRQILEIQRIQPLPSEGAIVVRGTPDQMALAQKLVGDLDRSKPEVVVDIAVMQINRDKNRTLGINPPTSMSIQLQPNVTTSTTTTTTGTPTTTPTTTTPTNGSINLNSLANLNATDFQVTISQATITALFSDTNTKLIQNPQLRSVDGQKATLKIGDRIPIATGSFQPGIGGVGINPLVNTQFQYQDVGVNIEVTPRVHANGDVTLKIAMDISSVTGQSNIGGITQPIIGQRKVDHEVRLREGEANLLGGMLEELNSKSLTGIPGLSQVPLLRYLFGQTATEHRETETVFVLIPHVVRRQVLTDLNQQAIDVGTASSINLRKVSRNAPPAASGTNPASGAGSVTVPQPPAPAAQPGAPSSEPQLVPRTGAAASFAFDPPAVTQKAGSTFTVNVLLSGAQNVYSVPLQLNYDPKLLQVVNVSNGSLLSQDGQIVTVTHREDDSSGTMQVTATRPPGASGITGQGPVVTLTFMAKAPGQSNLTIARGGARDPAMQAMPVNGAVATVTIQ